MSVSLSKTLAKFGGFRLGFGIRITKKNACYMAFIFLFACIIQLTWYMMLLCFWLMYAAIYGMYWCIRAIIRAAKKNKEKA